MLCLYVVVVVVVVVVVFDLICCFDWSWVEVSLRPDPHPLPGTTWLVELVSAKKMQYGIDVAEGRIKVKAASPPAAEADDAGNGSGLGAADESPKEAQATAPGPDDIEIVVNLGDDGGNASGGGGPPRGTFASSRGRAGVVVVGGVLVADTSAFCPVVFFFFLRSYGCGSPVQQDRDLAGALLEAQPGRGNRLGACDVPVRL